MQKIDARGYDLVSFKQLSQGKQKMRRAIRWPHASETDRQLYTILIYCNQCQHTLPIFLINYILSMFNIYAHLLSLLFIIGKMEENSRPGEATSLKESTECPPREKGEVQVFNSPLLFTHRCKIKSLYRKKTLKMQELCYSTFGSHI